MLVNRFFLFTQHTFFHYGTQCKLNLYSTAPNLDGSVQPKNTFNQNTLFTQSKEPINQGRSEGFRTKGQTDFLLRQYTNDLLNAYKRCRLPVTYKNLVTKCLNKMREENIKPNVVTLNTILKGFAKFSNVQNSLHYLDIFKDYKVKPDLVTYTIIIEGLAKVFQDQFL